MTARLYGIKNCDSVRKAVKFLKTEHIDYAFVDFRESPVDDATIRRWIGRGATVKQLFNTRGTTYRTLKLKELDLDEQAKIEWMGRENMLIKRPVLVLQKGILVGYDEKLYRQNLIKNGEYNV